MSIILAVQRSSIVTASLCITHTSTNGTNVLVFYIDVDRIQTRCIVCTRRRKNNHKQILCTRTNAQERVNCNDKRTNIQGSTFQMRYPILFHFQQFHQALHAQFYRQFRNDQTFIGTVQTLKVFFRTEQLNFIIGSPISLQAFKYSLTIMEAHCCRTQADVIIRNNFRVVPALTFVIRHNQHMVGKDMTKAQFAFILRLFL